jgi:hypothetical protein
MQPHIGLIGNWRLEYRHTCCDRLSARMSMVEAALCLSVSTVTQMMQDSEG